MIEIDNEIITVLWSSLMIYRDRCLKNNDIVEYIKNDDEYNGKDDFEYFLMMYLIQGLTREKNGVKTLHNKLLDAGIDKKKINSFIYSFLKLNHKTEKGLWSWNEIEEFNINFDNIKQTSTKYTLI